VGTVAGNFVELFSSVQGEGPHVGVSTLFVRLGVCDLRCCWCDSPHTWRAAEACRIQLRRGADEHRSVANPVSVTAIVEAAEVLALDRHAFVSITGGEPLLQPEVVRALADALRGRGPRIHLETHGLATAALAQVVEVVEYIMFGASPRASINLILTGKALAFVRGRDYAMPQDILDMALDVMRHRVVLSYEALSDNISSDDILVKILDRIPIPVVPLHEHSNFRNNA
jgi:organic radical activating enzyme